MRKTRTLENFPDHRPAAAGLRLCESRVLYLFEDMGSEISIGASARCHIRLDSPFVSSVHAVLRYRDGAMWIEDRSSQHTTFVDGWAIVDRPTAVLVGMEIQLGRTILMATDESGGFPISAHTPSEMSAKARDRYGSYRIAAEYLNRSHTTVRRHTRRYRARKSHKREDDR